MKSSSIHPQTLRMAQCGLLCAVALIAVIAPWIFYSCRTGHVFVDIVVFDGFCMTLFWLMIVNAAVNG